MRSVILSSVVALLGAVSFTACSSSSESGSGGATSATSTSATTDTTTTTSTSSGSGGAGGSAPMAYYLNFQDPKGEPTADPLIVDNHTWTKIGWEAYDAKVGHGWTGPHIGEPAVMLYKYFPNAMVNELQKSVIYDDYVNVDTFNWDLANGSYKVTVSIGFDKGTYPKNKVVIEGKTLFEGVAITPEAPYVVKSIEVDVTDGNLTMEVGEKGEYTMLNWMSIEAVVP